MSENRPKEILAWLVGILVFGAISYPLSKALSLLDVPYDSEKIIAIPGLAFFALPLMIALRAGMAAYKSDLRGGFHAKDEITFRAAFFGVLLYGVLSSLLGVAFECNTGICSVLFIPLQLFIVGVLVCILKPLHDMKIAALSNAQVISKQNKGVKEQIVDNLLMCVVATVILAALFFCLFLFSKLFHIIEATLDGTLLEDFSLLFFIVVFCITIIGYWALSAAVKNWWDRKRKMSGAKPVDTEQSD